MSQEIKLPKSWDEIYADQWVELKKLDDEESSFFIRKIKILAILTDTLPDDEKWEDLDVEELTKLIDEIKWLKYEPSNEFKKIIDDFTCIDINKLKLGEFIDLEYFFSESYIDNIFKICAILYRKTKKDEWGHLLYEPYHLIDINERSKYFEDLPISYIFGIIKYYLDFKETIISTYQLLFEPIINENEIEEEIIEYDPEEQEQIKKEEILTKWGWENVIYKLSNSDITKYDDITNLPLIFVLNHLSYMKDLNL